MGGKEFGLTAVNGLRKACFPHGGLIWDPAAMSLAFALFKEKSRLKALLDHFSIIDDPREPWRVAHPRQIARRAFRPQPLRDPLLHLLGQTLGQARGRGRARSLEHREPVALGADVVFAEDQCRLRKGHGARNMAVVRYFAVNLVRTAPEPERPPPTKPQRKATKPTRTSIKLRRKIAGWRNDYLALALGADAR